MQCCCVGSQLVIPHILSRRTSGSLLSKARGIRTNESFVKEMARDCKEKFLSVAILHVNIVNGRTSMPSPAAPAASATFTPSLRARIPCSSRSSMLRTSPSNIQASYPPFPSSPFCIAASSNSAASVNDPFCSSSLFASSRGDWVEVEGSRCLFSLSATGNQYRKLRTSYRVLTELVSSQDR